MAHGTLKSRDYRKCTTLRCAVNEDAGNSEVSKLRNYDASRNYLGEKERERKRERTDGQARDARWSVFARSFGNLRLRIAALESRKDEDGERRERCRKGSRHGREEATCRREGGGEGRNRAARSYRRQSKCNYPPPM